MICLDQVSPYRAKISRRFSDLTSGEDKRKKKSPCNSSERGIDQLNKLGQYNFFKERIFFKEVE